MKKLLGIMVLGLLFISAPAKADDIRDFEIEGMSIGDSLLDYFSDEEIKASTVNYYNDNKFTPVEFEFLPIFKIYDALGFNYKTDDKKYIIHSISGLLDFPNNIKDCYKKKDEIVKELKKVFINATSFDKIKTKHTDKSVKGRFTSTYFDLEFGDRASVQCYDWDKEMNYIDHLRIGIRTKEFKEFLLNKAYK